MQTSADNNESVTAAVHIIKTPTAGHKPNENVAERSDGRHDVRQYN